jgi:ABC-type methionine transport system permease subunit
MDTFWQVVIGSGIGGALLSIFGLYKSYLKESKENNEKQGMAKASILVGLSGIIFVFIGSIVGIILAIISMQGKKYKALSKIGLVVSILTALPWILVIILGQ